MLYCPQKHTKYVNQIKKTLDATWPGGLTLVFGFFWDSTVFLHCLLEKTLVFWDSTAPCRPGTAKALYCPIKFSRVLFSILGSLSSIIGFSLTLIAFLFTLMGFRLTFYTVPIDFNRVPMDLNGGFLFSAHKMPINFHSLPVYFKPRPQLQAILRI